MKRKSTALEVVLCLGCCCASIAMTELRAEDLSACNAGALLNDLGAAYRGGRHPDVIDKGAQALDRCGAGLAAENAARLRLLRAQSLMATGAYAEAAADLNAALSGLSSEAPPALHAALFAGLGSALLGQDRPAEAEAVLMQGLERAESSRDAESMALVHNGLGNLHAHQGDFEAALRDYEESARQAEQAGDPNLIIRAWLNVAGAAIEKRDRQLAKQSLERAMTLLDGLPETREKAGLTAGAGRRFHRAALLSEPPSPAELRHSYEALRKALSTAERTDDRLTESYALGYLGELYESQARHGEALNLGRRALFISQEDNLPELVYRWHWLIARNLRALGEFDRAAAQYRTAIQMLQGLRSEFRRASAFAEGEFVERSSRIYLEFADLLLKRAADPAFTGPREPLLAEARNSVELIKGAELEDYFQDDCVAALKSRTAGVEEIAADTAVLYPILFDDRVELLLSLADGIRRSTAPVAKAAIAEKVRTLRRLLEKRTTRQYLPHAQAVYDLLIRPFEPQLRDHGIKTLVLVPDDVLRIIPLSALHDGKGFLVESYSVAVTPGLTLTDPRPLEKEGMRVLLSGIIKSTQGFEPLPYVDAELKELGTLFENKLLRDEQFKVEALGASLAESAYGVVHIASHAQFGHEASDTFLLAHDDRITVNRLEQLIGSTAYGERPVDLLTLSACQTAAGDERAALGLAGIAVKAGARSALASLWFVNDQATSRLVTEFYRELGEPRHSKAEALRLAQARMISDRRYRHPGYWSAFLLIGNWL